MMNEGIKDLIDSISRLPLALYFAWSDTKVRYRRSILGPLWLVIGTAISVVGLGLVWSILLNQDKSKIVPSLTVGLVTWQLIAGSISDNTSAFVRNATIIRNVKTAFLFFPLQILLRNIVNFSHNFIIVFIVLLIFPPPFGLIQLLFFPGLLIVVLNLFWMGSLVAIISTRFRDVEQIVISIIPLLFFLSPVIFRPNQLGDMKYMIWFNPFSYFVALIRDPILGEVPQNFIYIVSISLLVIGWTITLTLLSSKIRRIPFWI